MYGALDIAQEGSYTIILTLTTRDGNFKDVHPKKISQAIRIVLHWMLIKHIVCSTSDLQTNDVK